MQEEQKQDRSKDLRKLVRSLSRVSEIDTKQIRKNIERQRHLKNQKKSEWLAASDQLLKENPTDPMKSILFSHRLFESRNKKIENFKQKQIDSQAFLKHATFEYRKIQMKKRNILIRQMKSQPRYMSAPLINKKQNEEHPLQGQSDQTTNPFQNNDIEPEIDHTSQRLINRIKIAMNDSKLQMRKLYEGHSRQLKCLSTREKTKLMNRIQNEQQPMIQQTESIIVPKKAKKVLNDLIRTSTMRAQRIDFQGTQLTAKQKQDILRTKAAIRQMQAGVQVSNKLKESIVLGQLKKLIYGDRRGRFIQDYTLKTRLKGEYTQHYMKVLHQQQHLLGAFNGSDATRKHLIQKFSGVLGTMSKPSRSPKQGEVSQFIL